MKETPGHGGPGRMLSHADCGNLPPSARPHPVRKQAPGHHAQAGGDGKALVLSGGPGRRSRSWRRRLRMPPASPREKTAPSERTWSEATICRSTYSPPPRRIPPEATSSRPQLLACMRFALHTTTQLAGWMDGWMERGRDQDAQQVRRGRQLVGVCRAGRLFSPHAGLRTATSAYTPVTHSSHPILKIGRMPVSLALDAGEC